MSPSACAISSTRAWRRRRSRCARPLPSGARDSKRRSSATACRWRRGDRRAPSTRRRCASRSSCWRWPTTAFRASASSSSSRRATSPAPPPARMGWCCRTRSRRRCARPTSPTRAGAAMPRGWRRGRAGSSATFSIRARRRPSAATSMPWSSSFSRCRPKPPSSGMRRGCASSSTSWSCFSARAAFARAARRRRRDGDRRDAGGGARSGGDARARGGARRSAASGGACRAAHGQAVARALRAPARRAVGFVARTRGRRARRGGRARAISAASPGGALRTCSRAGSSTASCRCGRRRIRCSATTSASRSIARSAAMRCRWRRARSINRRSRSTRRSARPTQRTCHGPAATKTARPVCARRSSTSSGRAKRRSSSCRAIRFRACATPAPSTS